MFEVEIINRITGEREIIYTHNRFNPFAKKPEYNTYEWEVESITYID